MSSSYKIIGCVVVGTALLSFMAINFKGYKHGLPYIQYTEVEQITPHPAVGLAHDDPTLIEFIRKQIQLPTGLPYNLDHPEATDFSEGQTGCVKKILHDKKDGFFLEVGAFDGEAASNSLYWEREKGWTGLLIEPNPEVYNALMSRKQRRGLRLQAALCLNNTANVITLAFPEFAKTWLKPLHPPGFVFPNIVEVPCYPLTSILSAIGNPIIDYFAMDLDGGEMDVLRSIDLKTADIHVFQIEHVNMKGGLDPLLKYMDENGYYFNTTCVVDAFFVKKGVNL